MSVAPINTLIISLDYDEEEEQRQAKMDNLQDLYDSINEVLLICLLIDLENIEFEETVRDKKSKATMDKEIKAIERDGMWDLIKLPKGINHRCKMGVQEEDEWPRGG